jgi:hypothetical protein
MFSKVQLDVRNVGGNFALLDWIGLLPESSYLNRVEKSLCLAEEILTD